MDADTHLVLASSSIMTRFLDSCSCMSMTFSTPLMMKYPPGSYCENQTHKYNDDMGYGAVVREREFSKMKPIHKNETNPRHG